MHNYSDYNSTEGRNAILQYVLKSLKFYIFTSIRKHVNGKGKVSYKLSYYTMKNDF